MFTYIYDRYVHILAHTHIHPRIISLKNMSIENLVTKLQQKLNSTKKCQERFSLSEKHILYQMVQ